MRIANLTTDMIPTAGRPTLSGKDFIKSQLDDNTRYLFVSIEGAPMRCRFDGGNPAEDPAHTMAQGEKGFWSRTAFLKAKFAGDGTVVATEFTV